MEHFFEKYFTSDGSLEKWINDPTRGIEMVNDEVTKEALHDFNQKIDERIDGRIGYVFDTKYKDTFETNVINFLVGNNDVEKTINVLNEKLNTKCDEAYEIFNDKIDKRLDLALNNTRLMQPLSDRIHENAKYSMSNRVKIDKQKREIEELKTEIKNYADNYADSSWVGINKYTPISSEYAEVILDFGGEKEIDWIGVETLNWPSKLIEVPTELKIYSSDNKSNWTLVGTYASPVVNGGADSGTYVLGNNAPLNTSARYFKVSLKNLGWAFISEIEVVGKNCASKTSKCYKEERDYPKEIEWAGLGSACCASTECVGQNDSCFAGSWTNTSSIGMHTGLNANGNDDSAYCYAEGTWLDCDRFTSYCDDASVCGEADGAVSSGETNAFGEYENFGESGCCGDDAGEYYVTTGSYSACCDNATDTVNASLECISGVEEPQICQDHEERYDSGQLNTQITNWKNGNLSLTEILLIAELYKNCQGHK